MEPVRPGAVRQKHQWTLAGDHADAVLAALFDGLFIDGSPPACATVHPDLVDMSVDALFDNIGRALG